MSGEFTMGLEDLKEDMEGNNWVVDPDTNEVAVVDEAGEVIEPPYEVDGTENEVKLGELMAIESLMDQSNLVSQDMVSMFQEHLPSTHPVESFTKLPSVVNKKVAVESLGGAIKIVALAGILTIIGGLGFILYKIIKRKKLMPKNDLDKKVSAAFASIDEKLKVGLSELKTMHPDIQHPNYNWSREEAVVRVASRRGVTECMAMILAGKYPFMPDKLYGTAADQGKQITVFLETQMVKQIEHLLKMGTEDDIKELEAALSALKVSDAGDQELRAYCKSLGLEVADEESAATKWNERFGQRLEGDAVKERIASVQPNFKPMGDHGLKQLLIVQERMAKVFQRLDKASKQLEGKKADVGGNYATKLKELVNKTKEPLSVLADVFAVSDAEVQAYNMCTRIKAEAIADGFSYLADQYKDLETSDKPNASAYRECQKHLRELFANVKSAIQ